MVIGDIPHARPQKGSADVYIHMFCLKIVSLKTLLPSTRAPFAGTDMAPTRLATATVLASLASAAGAVSKHARPSEVLSRDATEKLGVTWRGNSSKTTSHSLLSAPAAYPADFTWCDKDGKSYCTMSRNQHIPQYCGSCWAHGAVSALGDRVKIARGGQGVDVNLAVQHVLNCGNVGSCHGGSIDGTYQWLHDISKTGTGISYETAQPYMACSSESTEGLLDSRLWKAPLVAGFTAPWPLVGLFFVCVGFFLGLLLCFVSELELGGFFFVFLLTRQGFQALEGSPSICQPVLPASGAQFP